MNSNAITSFSGLNSENIKKDDYTNTLAAEALRVGLITEEQVDGIRNDLMVCLSEVIGYYTKNESSSIAADTARVLSKSMIFNIDTQLLTLKDDRRALEELLDRRMSELYGKGYLINSKLHELAKNLYGRARLTRLKEASEEYNKTLDKYFRYYLKDYSAKFSAHDKIYLSLREYGLSGAYHIGGAVEVLGKLCVINKGKEADIVITASPNQAHDGE